MANEALNDERDLVSRREALLRVSAILGGITLIGSESFLAGCRPADRPGADTAFTTSDVAYLDEIADTILPTTSTPGAKAAQTGAFMALMVRDTYDAKQQKIFRDGMRAIDDATQKAYKTNFMQATPQQRLAVLDALDREQKSYSDAREEEGRLASLKWLNDQRQEQAPTTPKANPAPAISEDKPPHFFRMMKELALLGYFTSEVGMTQAQRYVESPGRYDPCAPYTAGEKSWASHA
ncbi:MAG TPA: gluconate 2-dehydrogenase subunit 3 family protein [Gemmatimonadaceae bacterium]|nr:gluconate 2-dehydrogenase subunit 3 family protein [Gemmatimonadaceae bacterium]